MEEKTNPEQAAGTTGAAPEPVETYYEDESRESGWKQPLEWVCDGAGCVRDKVLKAVPVEVAEHLANSQKEFIRAGIALAEARMRKTDEWLERARTLHAKT